MVNGLKPLFCFVYSLYDDNGSYFRERDDYILSFYGNGEDEVLVNIQDLSPWSKEEEMEEYRTLSRHFGRIICNSEIVVNDYDFLTHEKTETFKSIVVQIFKLLSQSKIKYLSKANGNPLVRELFEKIGNELKEVFYSSELGDLM